MRRLARRLLTLCSVITLVLGVVFSVLGVAVDAMSANLVYGATLLLPGCATLLVVVAKFLDSPLPLGLCVHCGYDLRASPEGCPECGTVTSAPSAARTDRSA